jgi:hypothetical protein
VLPPAKFVKRSTKLLWPLDGDFEPKRNFWPVPASVRASVSHITSRSRTLRDSESTEPIRTRTSGISAHMIPILTGLGLSAGVAVWAATLRGVGQSLARLCEVLFGGRLDPLALGLLASSFLPVAFVAGLFGGASALAGAAFAFAYGAGNGLLTITRGTQPLVLFDPRTYGTLVGSLTAPGFFLSALAPVVYQPVDEVGAV